MRKELKDFITHAIDNMFVKPEIKKQGCKYRNWEKHMCKRNPVHVELADSKECENHCLLRFKKCGILEGNKKPGEV